MNVNPEWNSKMELKRNVIISSFKHFPVFPKKENFQPPTRHEATKTYRCMKQNFFRPAQTNKTATMIQIADDFNQGKWRNESQYIVSQSLFCLSICLFLIYFCKFCYIWILRTYLIHAIFSVFWSISTILSSVLDFPSDLQFLQSPFQVFWDSFKSSNYNWYHRHPQVPIFFCFLARSKYLSIFYLSFIFTQWSVGTVKSSRQQVLYFFIYFLLTLSLDGIIIITLAYKNKFLVWEWGYVFFVNLGVLNSNL